MQMTSTRKSRLTILCTLLVGLGYSANAHASECHVSDPLDDDNVAHTLRWCVAELHSGSYDSIEFDNSLTYELDDPLVLQVDSVVVGAGATISPSPSFSSSSLIEVDAGTMWEFQDLRFDGAGVAGPRAFEIASGSVVVFDSTELSGFNSGNDGGAILLDDAALYFHGGEIADCSASSGGAIAALAGEVHLSDSVLHGNVAAKDGGALFFGGTSPGLLSADTTQIVANAARNGGGIYAPSTSAAVDLSVMEVSGNTASEYGGGFYGAAIITSSSLVENRAGEGGGGVATDGSVAISQSYLTRNDALHGGGISVGTGAFLTLETSALFENTSTGEAGAAALEVPDGAALVVNTTFAYNEALDTGAAVMIDKGTLDLVHVTLGFSRSIGATNGLYVGPSANATAQSTMFGNGTNDCTVLGTWMNDTSMDESGTCPGTFLASTPPLGSCVDNGDYMSFCPPQQGQGLATCAELEDQLGNPRAPVGCWIGAFESP